MRRRGRYKGDRMNRHPQTQIAEGNRSGAERRNDTTHSHLGRTSVVRAHGFFFSELSASLFGVSEFFRRTQGNIRLLLWMLVLPFALNAAPAVPRGPDKPPLQHAMMGVANGCFVETVAFLDHWTEVNGADA